ncbi:MAG: hypothetical protein U5N85_00195 [Arcicella sp.]|nr:hypothetical protein [Arcicella sp.]
MQLANSRYTDIIVTQLVAYMPLLMVEMEMKAFGHLQGSCRFLDKNNLGTISTVRTPASWHAACPLGVS